MLPPDPTPRPPAASAPPTGRRGPPVPTQAGTTPCGTAGPATPAGARARCGAPVRCRGVLRSPAPALPPHRPLGGDAGQDARRPTRPPSAVLPPSRRLRRTGPSRPAAGPARPGPVAPTCRRVGDPLPPRSRWRPRAQSAESAAAGCLVGQPDHHRRGHSISARPRRRAPRGHIRATAGAGPEQPAATATTPCGGRAM